MENHEPLRVLLISTAPGFHGGEQQGELLWQGLLERGHAVLGVIPRESSWATRLAASGRAWFSLSGRGFNWNSLHRLQQAWNDFRPQVVYLNDPHAVTLWQVQLLGQRGRAWWNRSQLAPRPTTFAARRVDFPLKRGSRYRRVCDGLLCISRAIAEQCYRDGVPAEQLFVVPDGCNPARVAVGNAAEGRQLLLDDVGGGPIILCVARLADHKGHAYLLPAFARCLREFPRAVLGLAGDGELLNSLQTQAHELGIAPQVRWLGYTDRVPDLLAAADLSVIASHMEGLCSSIIDAMLARCPVVATRAGGIPDLLDERPDDPQQVGWLVPPRDAEALALGMVAALRNDELRRKRIDAAQKRALQLFTHTAMVEQTMRVFRAGIDGKLSELHYDPVAADLAGRRRIQQ